MIGLNQPSYYESVNILRLIRSENIGPKTFWNLINLYGSSSNALEAVQELSLRGGKSKSLSLYPQSAAEKEIESIVKLGGNLISYLDPIFPFLLKNTNDCPPILFTLGDVNILSKKLVSIVGSRNASANGLRFAFNLSKKLSQNDYIIVSGLARGIDTSAHKAALAKGTVAVLAGGIDFIYPPENKELYEEIKNCGLIISELPVGAVPKSQNFPQRNRIISGLSTATAVIEASLKSGSLITARYALEQNRELFVVPGFPLDFRYQGNNYLLKNGAHLLEDAEDIMSILDSNHNQQLPFFTTNDDKLLNNLTSFEEKELTQARLEIINLISASPTAIDEVIALSGLPAGVVLTVILELELAEKIVRHVGNLISKKL